MAYLGNQPALSYTSFAKQDFTTSATTSYTLDNPVANANELALFINFVRQEPTTAYTASGTSLTLTSATSASDDMYCVYLGKAVQTVTPPNNSVTSSMLASGNLTIPNGNLLFDTADKGIYLGVTSATASNLLDDYEEGHFTPALQDTAGNEISITARAGNFFGHYIKIGNLVTVTFAIDVRNGYDTTGVTLTDDAYFVLPFVVKGHDVSDEGGSLSTLAGWKSRNLVGITSGYTLPRALFVSENTNRTRLAIMTTDGTTWNSVDLDELIASSGSTTQFTTTFIYETT